MPSDEINRSRVVIFTFSEEQLQLAIEGAEAASWQPVPFDNPTLAFEELNENIKALITAMPVRGQEFGREPANQLISRSNELDIPRAIMSAKATAHNYIRDEARDIVIPSDSQLYIPTKIADWLQNISIDLLS